MNQMQNGSGSGMKLGAHEIISMNEALMTKSANVEMLSWFSQQVNCEHLSDICRRQSQAASQHYMQGVNLLQQHGHDGGFSNHGYDMQYQTQPLLGLRQPNMPAPNMNAQRPSERAIAATVLNMHKHGAVSWMQFALECTSPQLRGYLVEGATMCDKMAYEIWMYMNEKGYYQVPTLKDQTTQTMINSFQQTGMPAMQTSMQSTMMPHAQMGVQ